jgi:hypothetical protein
MIEYTALAISPSFDPDVGRTDLSKLLPLDLRYVQWVESQAEASLVLLNHTDHPIPDFLAIEVDFSEKCGIDPLLVRTLARIAPQTAFRRKRLTERKVILIAALSSRAQEAEPEGLPKRFRSLDNKMLSLHQRAFVSHTPRPWLRSYIYRLVSYYETVISKGYYFS